MNKYKKLTMYLIFMGIVSLLIGITYSFFNYTRTGAINNIGTGTINFNSIHGPTLSITSLFPMTSDEASNANLDSTTIQISGNTTYSGGEEFLVSIEEVSNTYGKKSIPINYIASYESSTGGSIGSLSNNYWNERNNASSNIYLLSSEGEAAVDNKILVGYIKSGETSISGTLTISAYIDADRIAISDTYSEYFSQYLLNSDMTQEELNNCATYVTTVWQWKDYMDSGTTGLTFCQGIGTNDGDTFQENIYHGYFNQEEMNYLMEHNIIISPEYTDDTSREWVSGRTVFTTSEWNSFVSNPLSFKIRVESNEGIWVYEIGKIDTCPNCIFTFSYDTYVAKWHTSADTATSFTTAQLSSGSFSEDYRDIVKSTNNNCFLGLVLDNNNEIDKAYACGLYNSNIPFCVEGYYSNSKYSSNQETIQRIWNNTCDINTSNGNEVTFCDGLIQSGVNSSGGVGVADDNGDCSVYSNGNIGCSNY